MLTEKKEWKSLEVVLLTYDKKYFDQIEDYLYKSGDISPVFLEPLELVYAPLTLLRGAPQHQQFSMSIPRVEYFLNFL